MKFYAKIYVSLKKGYSDPEGETAANALRGLGYNVEGVRSSKAYEITFNSENKETASTVLEEMCRRLLTNPTKDDFSFEISEIE
jgi:phosphoribosylformylglycinamidine synthase PurS subunit